MTSPLVDIARRLRDAGRAAFWRGEGAHAIMSQIADEIEALAASEPEPRPEPAQRGGKGLRPGPVATPAALQGANS